MRVQRLGFWLAFLGVIIQSAPLFSQIPSGVSLSVQAMPPEIPEYDRPAPAGEEYLWVPGYWAYASSDKDYFWVPGFWEIPPEKDMLWTPGYWGWRGNGYFYYVGYWGKQVGFYGGINYGHGYNGNGNDGAEWKNGKLIQKPIQKSKSTNRASFNGPKGVERRPTVDEMSANQNRNMGATKSQMRQEREAKAFLPNRASKNKGIPKVMATRKVGEFVSVATPEKTKKAE